MGHVEGTTEVFRTERICLKSGGKQLSWEMKRKWEDEIKTGLKQRG
jgi:hypothetical protein